jgi:CelD/BcsL family acetyltransferase involved in cellulose biosynthesis
MIESRVIQSIDELAGITPAWRALLDRASGAEPVLTPTWTLAWWRAFGAGRHLRALTLWDGPELVGLAPLSLRQVLTKHAIPTRKVELLMTGEDHASEICSDYVGVLAAPGFELTLAHRLAGALASGELGSWDQLVLSALNGELPVVELLGDALQRAGVRCTIEPEGACPYIPLPTTWEAYLKALPSSGRYTVTRALRDLESWAEHDGFRLRTATDDASLREGRAVLHALHGERWNDEASPGVFADPTFAAFHDEVMPTLLGGTDGQLELHWLEVRGQPIAAIYNIVYRGKVYFYQSGRKVDVPKGIKPGIAIHALAIRRAIEAGRTEYDFLSGESQYKHKLCLASRPLARLSAISPTLRGRAVDAATHLLARAAARVRPHLPQAIMQAAAFAPDRSSRRARSSGT